MAQYSPTTVTTGQLYTATIINADRSAVATAVNSVDNSQISASANIAISKTALGTYTPWTDYTPNFPNAGSMTFSTTPTVARYLQIGKLVCVQVTAYGTIGGTVNSFLYFSLPFTPALTADDSISGGCKVRDGNGTEISGYYNLTASTNLVDVHKYDGNIYTLGSNGGFGVQLFYEVA